MNAPDFAVLSALCDTVRHDLYGVRRKAAASELAEAVPALLAYCQQLENENFALRESESAAVVFAEQRVSVLEEALTALVDAVKDCSVSGSVPAMKALARSGGAARAVLSGGTPQP